MACQSCTRRGNSAEGERATVGSNAFSAGGAENACTGLYFNGPCPTPPYRNRTETPSCFRNVPQFRKLKNPGNRAKALHS